MRKAHIALVITTAFFPDAKRSITQKNFLCKRKKLSLRGKSDKRINFLGGPRAVLVRLTKNIGRYTNKTGQTGRKILPSDGELRADHRRSSTAPLVKDAGRRGRRPLRNPIGKPSVGATLAVARGRGNRRSAASGGGSEPVSRKCPDWRVRQCPSVGWHDGGQESPAPTHHQEPTAPGGQGRPPLQPYS